MRISTMAVAMAAICTLTGFGKVVYENDFATRTSEKAIPTSGWYEIPYSVGILARDYARTWSSDNTPYERQNEVQDGWALANYGNPTSTGDAMAPAYVSTNTVQQVPEGDSRNQFFEMHGNGSMAGAIVATHPIGNDFTNGNDHIGAVGIGDSTPGSSPNTTFHPYFRGTYDTSIDCTPTNWYRIVQTADMATKKFDCAIYHLVSGEIDGEPIYTAEAVDFANQVAAIGSFAISAYGPGNADLESVCL